MEKARHENERHENASEWVEFNAPLDTIQVISEAEMKENEYVGLTYCRRLMQETMFKL